MAAKETGGGRRHGVDPNELDFLGGKIMRVLRALHERRETPATEKAVEAANRLVEQYRFAEAADAWDEIYFNGTVFEGRDFYGPRRSLGCEVLKGGRYKALCCIEPPPDIRKGDVVHLWIDVTIRVEKIEKVFYSGLPYLLVQGRKHDCSEDRLLAAPWLDQTPLSLWALIKARFHPF